MIETDASIQFEQKRLFICDKIPFLNFMLKKKSCNWQFVKKSFFPEGIFVIGQVSENKQLFMVGLIL